MSERLIPNNETLSLEELLEKTNKLKSLLELGMADAVIASIEDFRDKITPDDLKSLVSSLHSLAVERFNSLGGAEVGAGGKLSKEQIAARGVSSKIQSFFYKLS